LHAREQRIRLLRDLPGLSPNAPDLPALADALDEASYAPGEVVFREGDAGDEAFVIAAGRATLTAKGLWTTVELASLGAGEIVGELTLVSPGRTRNATLTAETALRVLVLDRTTYHRFIASDPRRQRAFALYAEELLTARFIREVDPFAALRDPQRRALAKRVRRRKVGTGDVIVKRGDPGHTCIMLRSGKAEILQVPMESADADERRVAVIEGGDMIGEAALLTGGPRNATVRALEPCELLELHADDLFEIARSEPRAARGIIYLFRLRSRPVRAEEVVASEQVNAEGETITVLRNPARPTSYALSPRGRFIWDRLDGSRTLRELTIEYGREFGSVTPQSVGEVAVRLARAGMLKDASIGSTPLDPDRLRRSRLRRAMKPMMTWIREHGGARVAKRLRGRPDPPPG
jgi:CRP-like cAMP-binding protein